MEEDGRRGAAEQASQADLAARRGEEVRPADHQVDALPPVVDGDGELIRPVPLSVPDQQIAALSARVLGLVAEPRVLEGLGARLEADTEAVPVEREPSVAAAAVIAQFG